MTIKSRRNKISLAKRINTSKLPFIIARNQIHTHSQVLSYVKETEKKLEMMGMSYGMKIAILSRNSLEYVVLLCAMWRRGIVPVPLNIHWPPRPIEDRLSHIGCHHILFSKEFQYHQDFRNISALKILSVVDLTTRSVTGDYLKLEDFPLEQDATILFTSGTSGEPKAILHTVGNHYYSALGSNRNIPLQPGDRWLLSLPLYHVGGISIIFRTLLSGTTLAIAESKKSIAGSMAELKPSHLSLVSTQFFRLLSMPGIIEQLQAMKAILLGGGSIPDRLIQRAYQNNLPVFVSYGSTEMASQITTTRPGDSFWNLKTSGKLLAHRDLTFAVDGEILVKGLTLFKGYLKEKRLLDPRDPEGWFHTADIGYHNEKGYLVVTGRKDNMFISGGENIQPEEIESAMKNIEGVEEVVVVPVPHHEYGQRPVAFIKLSDGRQIKAYQLKHRLEKILPKYKIPEHFLDWPGGRGTESFKLKRELFKNIAIGRLSKNHS